MANVQFKLFSRSRHLGWPDIEIVGEGSLDEIAEAHTRMIEINSGKDIRESLALLEEIRSRCAK